jgi:hypothetical protein
MKRDPAPRAMKMFVQCVSRWLVVAAFAGIGHATASTAGRQHDKNGQYKPMPPQSMDGCPQCAIFK